MRKLLSTDFDGTLVFNKQISAADQEALATWREAGNLVVPNTGRSITALGSALAGFDVPFDAAVLYTGAVITDSERRPVHVVPMPEGVPLWALDLFGDEPGVSTFVTTLDEDFHIHDTLGLGTELLTLFHRGSLADVEGRTVIGVPFHLGSEALIERVLDEVPRQWGDTVLAYRNQDFVDLVPGGSSKGSGMVELVRELTAEGGAFAGERISTWSIGDSWNDLSMHAAADHAFALPWSPEDVKEACDMVIGSVAELVELALGWDEDDGAAASRGRAAAGGPEDSAAGGSGTGRDAEPGAGA